MELLIPLTRTTSCKSHGEYLSVGTPIPVPDGFQPLVRWTDCELCIEQRAKEATEAERRAAERKEAAERAELRKRIVESGIPPLFRAKRLSHYVAENTGQKKALKGAATYATNFGDAFDTGRNLLFIGKPGCGKTHLACAIGLEVLDMGGTVRYAPVGGMVQRVADAWRNRAGESASEVLADLASADLLILDEAGVQSGSDVELRVLMNVIDTRYGNQLPTILISNLGIDKLEPLLGDRVIDRLRDNGSKMVAFDWTSYRGKREARQ